MRAYSDQAESNSCCEIPDAVGEERLLDIVVELIGLLGTSAAVYEKNGDYSAGIITSAWCRFLDEASGRLRETDGQDESDKSCGWHCHESSWREASRMNTTLGDLIFGLSFHTQRSNRASASRRNFCLSGAGLRVRMRGQPTQRDPDMAVQPIPSAGPGVGW